MLPVWWQVGCGAAAEAGREADGFEELLDLFVIVAGGAGGSLVGALVAGGEGGLFALEVVHEDFFGGALEEEDAAAEPLGTVGFGFICEGGELGFGVVEAGQDRGGDDAAADAGSGERLHGGEAEVGAGGFGFEAAGEVGIEGGDGEVDVDEVALGDLFEDVEVAWGEVAFGGDPEFAARLGGENFEDAAGEFVAALGVLVGVGGGAKGDGLGLGDAGEFAAEFAGVPDLGEDAGFEILRFAQFHKFVGVAGVTVLAGHFAAAVGIDGPIEGEAGIGDAVDPLAGREVAVGDGALRLEEGRLKRRLRDADELHRENELSFAFSSSVVKGFAPIG